MSVIRALAMAAFCNEQDWGNTRPTNALPSRLAADDPRSARSASSRVSDLQLARVGERLSPPEGMTHGLMVYCAGIIQRKITHSTMVLTFISGRASSHTR